MRPNADRGHGHGHAQQRKVRRWVTISFHNGTQLDPYPHLVHCLDQLLQNVRCEADDTPLYTDARARGIVTGDGQVRACQSWARLREWARARPACFAYVNETQGADAPSLRRYRYCPRDSPFLGRMREFFGYPDGWWEPAPEDVDSMPKYLESFREEEVEY